ncbi:MAG: hypothetical protein GC184_02465 [Rhizobiales bacterium]|nr:hypothetical protein [Hyphomicrobiales bacterium]
MSESVDQKPVNVSPSGGQSAYTYGRNAEPLPELHVFSRLSELDGAYASDLAKRRARQETLEREIVEIAKRLTAPLDGPIPDATAKAKKRRGLFGRSLDSEGA